jgi:spore coat protein U-like protein
LKKVLAAAAVAAAFAIVPNAQAAGTANNNFNVTTTLTSQCTATNSGTQTVDFGPYTAFQASANTGTPISLTFQCTRNFGPITAAFDTGTGAGVITGLQYTLTASAPTLGSGIPATPTVLGTGDTKTYAITGTMPAGQAGDCAGATCAASALRTLIVSF